MTVTTQADSARADFAAIVGEPRVTQDEKVCAGFAVDGKAPRLVVYCKSAEDVAQSLRRASERGLAVIPCRNGTKLGIGNIPSRYDVALSLKEMTRVWHYEPADLTISVEPGMKLADFQHFVGRDGLWLPLDPPGAARASLGGILAANSTGPLRLAFGAPRDMVLGMKIATTEGKIIKTGGRVVKNVAGYDFAKLLIGSFGTLGVIVEASFKLYPLPVGKATFVFTPVTLDGLRDLRGRLLDSPLAPLRAVYLNDTASEILAQGSRPLADLKGPGILVEAGGSARVIERTFHELEAMSRTTSIPLARCDDNEAENLWARAADFGSFAAGPYPRAASLKATLPIASCEDFMARAQQESAKEKIRIAGLCQFGAGIVHLHLLDKSEETLLAALIERLRGATVELGGRLIVERCSPALKTQVDAWGLPDNDLRMMRKVKDTWDPTSILSPGRFAGGI